MTVRLEHANLCVRDIKGMIRFLQTAFPEFRVRGEGISNDGTRWVHIGTHETYIALGQSMAEPAKHWTPYQGLPGVNHLAYEVDDVEALRNRMKAAGYGDSTPPNAGKLQRENIHPGGVAEPQRLAWPALRPRFCCPAAKHRGRHDPRSESFLIRDLRKSGPQAAIVPDVPKAE